MQGLDHLAVPAAKALLHGRPETASQTIVASALASTQPPVQEGDILAAQEAYSAAKRGMLDLYTKRALVHALQSPEAFVGLDTALHTATSQYETMKAQVGEIKGAAAARRDELDALAVQVARSNAAVTAKRAELARLLAVYETAASQPLPPQSLVAGAVTITSPADAARVAEEMAAAASGLSAEAASLRDHASTVAAAGAKLRQTREELEAKLAKLKAERAETAAHLARTACTDTAQAHQAAGWYGDMAVALGHLGEATVVNSASNSGGVDVADAEGAPSEGVPVGGAGGGGGDMEDDEDGGIAAAAAVEGPAAGAGATVVVGVGGMPLRAPVPLPVYTGPRPGGARPRATDAYLWASGKAAPPQA